MYLHTQEWGQAEELVELWKNILSQICMLKKIAKIIAALLQRKDCKDDAHDDTFTCKRERGGRGGRVRRVDEKWTALAMYGQ